MSLADLGIEKLPNYGQPLDKHPVDAGRLRSVIERVTARRGGVDAGSGRPRARPRGAPQLPQLHRRRRFGRASDRTGRSRSTRCGSSFDAGTVVNSDRVRAQMEGSVIFGMSLALYGGITMKDGAIEQDNFRDGGRIVRIGEAPRRTHVDLVESDAPPGGVGEPGVPPVAPAIANAVFALTGNGFASCRCRSRYPPLVDRHGRSLTMRKPTANPSPGPKPCVAQMAFLTSDANPPPFSTGPARPSVAPASGNILPL